MANDPALTAYQNDDARFVSILDALPFREAPRLLIDWGCGGWTGRRAIQSRFGNPYQIGVDWQARPDGPVDPYCEIHLQADLRTLPVLSIFDAVICRHPNVHYAEVVWETMFANADGWLRSGGVLLVTNYSIPEYEKITALTARLPLLPITIDRERLAPVNFTGADRYVQAWQK